MSLNNFIVEQGIIGIVIGTIIGFGFTNFIKDIKYFFILPFLIKLRLTKNKAGILSSILELFFIIIFVYILYQYIIEPLLKKQLNNEKKKNKDLEEWRENILNKIKDIDCGNVYM